MEDVARVYLYLLLWNKSPDDVQLAIYDYAVERANGTLFLFVAKII